MILLQCSAIDTELLAYKCGPSVFFSALFFFFFFFSLDHPAAFAMLLRYPDRRRDNSCKVMGKSRHY